MTPTERALWERIQRRAAGLSPSLSAAVLRAFAELRAGLSEFELARLIRSGSLERVLTEALSQESIGRAMRPVRSQLQKNLERATHQSKRDLPRAIQAVGPVPVFFDTLSPRVLDAVRTLDTRVIRTLGESVRDTVRQHIAAGIEAGENPTAIARGLRDVIGLAPNQEEAVRNFRRALQGEHAKSPLEYKLRDRRFDAAIRKGELTHAQVNTMTGAYRRRMLAFNAETNARTATLDALRMGQRLAWEDAIERGAVERERLMKRWVTVGDDRVRVEHVEMNGEEVPFDALFSNGQMVPGESDFNCRCISLVSVTPGRAA